MFVGSFYRLQNRNDIERKIPLGSSTSIIYIEDEGKFYERNIYGLVSEYNVGHYDNIDAYIMFACQWLNDEDFGDGKVYKYFVKMHEED